MIRYLFDSELAAAEALGAVLKYARSTEDDFTFGGLSLPQLLSSGLWLTGETDGIAEILDKIEGAVRQETVGR